MDNKIRKGVYMKSFKEFLTKSSFKSKMLELTDNEKNLIGDLKIHKVQYQLDRTQSYYRYDKNTTSIAFTGTENLDALKKLIKLVKSQYNN